MASPERTQKGPNDFPSFGKFIDYCKTVAMRMYDLFINNRQNEDN